MLLEIILPVCMLASSAGQTIDLARPKSERIGHVDVFSYKAQSIEFSIHPPMISALHGKLFRRAGNTLAPVTGSLAIRSDEGTSLTVVIDFPSAKTTTNYILILDTPEPSRLDISAHPVSLLAPLQQQSRAVPITLIRPPEGLSAALDRLGIASVTRESLDPEAPGILVLFGHLGAPPTHVKASRLVTVAPARAAEREVWISRGEGKWTLRIPPSYLNPNRLATAHLQATLKRILLDDPTNH